MMGITMAAVTVEPDSEFFMAGSMAAIFFPMVPDEKKKLIRITPVYRTRFEQE